MENWRTENYHRLSEFLRTGTYVLDESETTVFIDPVRLLNRYYTRFKVSPTDYYSRFFPQESKNNPTGNVNAPIVPCESRKRKRKKQKQPRTLNVREEIANRRHQDVRPLLARAHEALIGDSDLLGVLRSLRKCGSSTDDDDEFGESLLKRDANDIDFVELGNVWQAQLCEITLNLLEDKNVVENEDHQINQCCEQRTLPLFNNLVENPGFNDVVAELLNNKYVMPMKSCFYMSDLQDICNLIPAESDSGFNMILIDPPWENSSAHQKSKYQTLPNRYFLSLPINQLVHTHGALVALWVTNREKLRRFVENDLFPSWGVKYATTFYWLKVKPDGTLISELDLFHHRPYECLVLGYCHCKNGISGDLQIQYPVPHSQVFISVPGDYSRKPPLGDLLSKYAPCLDQQRCIELFARELTGGWNSWGNEPLYFQDSKYFMNKLDR